LILVFGAILAVPLGCNDPLQRYRVLSMFFDGVPPPEGYEPVGSIGDATNRESDRSGRPPEEQQINYRYHAPYVQRQCFECHDRNVGYVAQVQGVESCQSCHEDYFKIADADWIHGPIVMLECARCHAPHRSPYPGLLTQPQLDLCYQCHDASWIEADPFHRQVEDLTCSNCHDPHAAGNRLLLVDARSFERRSKIRHVSGSEHPPWQRNECAACHLTEQGNVLVDNVDQACFACHEDQLEVTDVPLHKAVSELQCTFCHTAHKSPRPNLIRPTAEDVCFKCHKRQEIQTLAHPNVTYVDCLVCHTGHRAQRKHMLREGVGVPAEQTSLDYPDDLIAAHRREAQP